MQLAILTALLKSGCKIASCMAIFSNFLKLRQKVLCNFGSEGG